MRTFAIGTLVSALLLTATARSADAAGTLRMDDLASQWPRAGRSEKVDFTDRMGRAMIALSPDLTNTYFLNCLEETANIGDTKELTLGDFVRTCIAMKLGRASE
ncbi:hypothetical protein [Methylobacterium sp. A54F]